MTTPTFTPPPTAPARTQGPDAYVTNFNAWIAWHTNHFVSEIGTAVSWIADQVTAIAANAAAALGYQNAAAVSAATASAAASATSSYLATSVTPLTIGPGAKAITLVEAARTFADGDDITLISRSNPLNQMHGPASASNMGAKTVTVTVAAGGFTGSGAGITDWMVVLTAFASYQAPTANAFAIAMALKLRA